MSHRPPRLALLILGLLFGASYALMTKPVQGPDEERHMYRVFLVSSGVCTGQPAIPAPEQRYGERFDYMLANPPFGVEWKKVERQVREEHERFRFAGRF